MRMSGHIYVIHPREFLGTAAIFEVGHTTRDICAHLCEHNKKGCRLLYSRYVNNVIAMKASLLRMLSQSLEFQNTTGHGPEYFQANPIRLIRVVSTHVNVQEITAIENGNDCDDDDECCECCDADADDAGSCDAGCAPSAHSAHSQRSGGTSLPKITDPTLTIAAFMEDNHASLAGTVVPSINAFSDFKGWCLANRSTIGAQDIRHGEFVSTLEQLYGIRARISRTPLSKLHVGQVLDLTHLEVEEKQKERATLWRRPLNATAAERQEVAQCDGGV